MNYSLLFRSCLPKTPKSIFFNHQNTKTISLEPNKKIKIKINKTDAPLKKADVTSRRRNFFFSTNLQSNQRTRKTVVAYWLLLKQTAKFGSKSKTQATRRAHVRDETAENRLRHRHYQQFIGWGRLWETYNYALAHVYSRMDGVFMRFRFILKQNNEKTRECCLLLLLLLRVVVVVVVKWCVIFVGHNTLLIMMVG